MQYIVVFLKKIHNEARFKLLSLNFRRFVPNLISSLSLFSGLLAVKAACSSDFNGALFFILMASFFDLIDGKVARFLKSNNQDGVLIDSFIDFANYGFATSVIFSMFFNFSFFSLFIVFIYISNIMFRLVRFTVNPVSEKTFFKGVSSPFSAILIIFPIAIHEIFNLKFNLYFLFFSYVYGFIVAFLPYSNIPILTGKNLFFISILLKNNMKFRKFIVISSSICVSVLLLTLSLNMFLYSLMFSYISLSVFIKKNKLFLENIEVKFQHKSDNYQ